MSLFELLNFAWKALSGHRLRTALSVFGVTIGVTSVVLLTALGEGARMYVTGELASLGSNVLIVLPGKVETSGTVPFVGGVPHDLTLSDAQSLQRSISRIKQLAPLTLGDANVSYGSLNRDVSALGTSAEFLSLRRLKVSRGSFLPAGDFDRGSSVCVIGTKIQQELFKGENPLGKILNVGEWRFRVIGVLEPKGQTMGFNIDDLVLIPVAMAMKLFHQTTLFRIMIEVNSYDDLSFVKDEIVKVIKERHNGEDDITLITQDSVLTSFNQIFVALTLALAGIAAISLTVAGIGIMNVMLVSVSERTTEVGLLKALGVKPRQIVSVFLAEAALLSALGGILGLVAAKLLVDLARKLFPVLPTEIPGWAVVSALAIALSVGIVFGVWPARRASRLDPLVALSRR
jgi:putative ABC transport system permease protein